MGGYEAGDRASAAVVDAFRGRLLGREFATLEDVRDALLDADDKGRRRRLGDDARRRGSTVSGLALVQHEGAPHWLVFNVGDSRV